MIRRSLRYKKELNNQNTKVIMTTKITNKKPAFLNIFVKNAEEISFVILLWLFAYNEPTNKER